MRNHATWLALAAGLLLMPTSRAADWPQWLGRQRDGVWRETGILSRFPESGPKLLWRVPLGMGFSGPAIADGRVYVMDRQKPEGPAPKAKPGEKPRLAG